MANTTNTVKAIASTSDKVKKVTKREQYTTLSALVMSHPDISAEEKDRLTAFIAHEVELLDKKSASKPKKASEADNAILSTILEKLADYKDGVTITTLQATFPDLFYQNGEISNQKMSSLMKKLTDSKQVIKTINKKKAYFSLPALASTDEVTE